MVFRTPIARMGLPRAALAAAATLGLERSYGLFGQIKAFASSPVRVWPGVPWLLANFALAAPLPVLLLILYRAGGLSVVSKKLRWLALGSAIVYGTVSAGPAFARWIGELQRNVTNIRLFRHTTIAADLADWAHTGDASQFFRNTFGLATRFALFYLLVALSRHLREKRVAPMNSLFNAAQIATAAGVLSVAINIGQQVYAAIRFMAWQNDLLWPGRPSRGLFLLNNAVAGLAPICMAILPWIIYKTARGMISPPTDISSADLAR